MVTPPVKPTYQCPVCLAPAGIIDGHVQVSHRAACRVWARVRRFYQVTNR